MTNREFEDRKSLCWRRCEGCPVTVLPVIKALAEASDNAYLQVEVCLPEGQFVGVSDDGCMDGEQTRVVKFCLDMTAEGTRVEGKPVVECRNFSDTQIGWFMIQIQ